MARRVVEEGGPRQRPKSTAKKLEGGLGASSAKGEHFPRQSSGVAPYEEDHEISAEVCPDDEEIVLVDPHDDDGAVDSPGEETPDR